jgi:O-antigen/teichoic acid export membrane protein
MEKTLKEKTAKGLLWGSLNNTFMQLMGLVFGIILGRLLSPSDYGMMAMIVIFSAIAGNIQDSGFKAALINQKEVRHEDYNSVFWFNVVTSLCIYAILFFCAPLIALYYRTPELIPLCRYSFIGFVFASLNIAQSSYLAHELRFEEMAKGGMTAITISSITGAVMAFLGCGYWSLATQSILFIGINAMMSWYYSPWRPTFEFSFAPIKRMFPFSVKMLITSIFNSINNNVLNIILGRYYSKHDVGNYYQGNQWNTKGYTLVQGTIGNVAQPVLASVKEDNNRQVRVFSKMIRFTALISFPLMFGLALVADEFIVITITSKWIASAALMKILCIGGAFVPIANTFSNLIVSKGKSNIFMWCTMSISIAQIAFMVILSGYGIRTMVMGFTCLTILSTLLWQYFAHRLTGYNIMRLFKDIAPFILASAGTMISTYYITHEITNIYLLLISRIIIAATIYCAIMKIARVKIFDECVSFILQKIHTEK